jgi:hypothetical protein
MKRFISGVIAILYLIVAYLGGGGKGLLQMTGFLVLPMACIWYSEAMGDFTGNTGRGFVTSTTPGCIVAFGGWLLLFLPVVVGIIMWVEGKG